MDQPDYKEAERFLKLLDPTTERFTFQTFDDRQDRGDERLARILHGTLAEHFKQLCGLNAAGAGIFVTVNKTDLAGRSADNVVQVRALFTDNDGNAKPNGFIEPSIEVDSSPERDHTYWLANDVTLAEFPGRQKALAEKFGSDPKVHDLSRVMRLPGFFHRKQETPFLVRVRRGDGNAVYSVTQFPPAKIDSSTQWENLAPVCELDLPLATRWAIDFLENTAPCAIQGAYGDNTTLQVARTVKDKGISEEVCTDLMLTHWNEVKALPPWDAPALAVKVANAYRYAKNPPGCTNPLFEFRDFIDPTWKAEYRQSRGYYVEELQRRPIVPLEWICEDFILAGELNGLFGDGGTGKDTILLQLGLAMACGAQWLGRPVRQGRVLYLPSEDSDDALRRREDCITRHYQALGSYDLVHQRFRIEPMPGTNAVLAAFSASAGVVRPTAAYTTLCGLIEKYRPELVIVGNRVNIFSVNQNDDAQAAQCNALLTALCRKYRTAVVMPSHVSLSGKRSGEGTSGSVQWSNGARLRSYLRRVEVDGVEPDKDARVLETMKANYSATGRTIAMHWIDGVFVPDTSEEWGEAEMQAADDREVLRLLDALTAQGQRVSPHPDARNNIVTQLSRRGMFQAMGRAKGRARVEAAKGRLFAAGVITVTRTKDSPSRQKDIIVRARNEA